MLRRTAATALLALAAAPAAHAAGPPIMALSDVRAGMVCTVASVIHGTAISSFDARVDDVIQPGSDPATGRILVTVSGPAIDGTGVGPGFSGSPITCPGADGTPRIAGAITETIGAFGGKTVLATPIQAILGEPVDPPHAAVHGARAAGLMRGAQRISEPLSYSGLSPAVGRVFQRAAARAGRTLVLAPLRPAQAPAAPAIVPGSAIGVTLATGDIDAGAVGTAAYVDGSTVWGFGHPFDGAGKRSLFLTAAYVYGIVNNPLATADSATYKLAAPTATIGTLTQDGVSGVVGRLGPLPRSFPLQISVRDLDTRRLTSLRAQVADERALGLPTGSSALSAVAAPAIVQGLYGALDGSPVRQSADMCLRITVRGRKKPLGFCNTYVGGGGSTDALASGPLVADAAAATQILDSFDAAPLVITGAQVGLRVARGLRVASLKRLRAPATARRGSTISVRATLAAPGGGTVVRTLRVAVPRGVPRGPRTLFLKGTEADVSRERIQRRLDDDRSVVTVRAGQRRRARGSRVGRGACQRAVVAAPLRRRHGALPATRRGSPAGPAGRGGGDRAARPPRLPRPGVARLRPGTRADHDPLSTGAALSSSDSRPAAAPAPARAHRPAAPRRARHPARRRRAPRRARPTRTSR